MDSSVALRRELPRRATVAVAMSGGVDSSVAAARCVAAGYKTIGITLAMWPRDRALERDRGCCSIDAVEDARRVAGQLGIPHYAWNLEAEFNQEVVDGFETEYLAGRTPNPCISCNSRVKFGVLLERARSAGADYVATGHYAGLRELGSGVTLHRPLDLAKDQSYTLHRLNQQQLDGAYFPLGDISSKAEVRQMAGKLGFGTAQKPESQELCFVDSSLSQHLAQKLAGRFQPGPIFDTDGNEVGTHRGLPFYTVGQRARLGIAPKDNHTDPLYVLGLDAPGNSITVGPREMLERRAVVLTDCSWINDIPRGGNRYLAQWRAHGKTEEVEVSGLEADGKVLHLRGIKPLFQLAPGQALVLYDSDRVVGGGPIAQAV